MANIDYFEQKDSGLSIGLASPAPEVLLTPNIGVIGVGGAGGNAVNNMIDSELEGISFAAANTDAQALSKSKVLDRIQLGVALTQGLGAGANPEVGKAAVEESLDKVKESIKGLHLLFITAGMGGGTGTGASPVIAKLAKDMGILTVGVVSTPFRFEGAKRMRVAQEGINQLKKYVDTLIVIPNQNLFRIISNTTSFIDAFKMADGVLCQGVRLITDLVMKPGMMNLDFSDVKTVLSSMGRAMMGTGEASGDNRATDAVEMAISNPLLDNSSIKGAKSVLINISGGLDLTLSEVDYATERIRQELDDEDAVIIFGTCVDEALNGSMRISFFATGISEDDVAPTQLAPPPKPTPTIIETVVVNDTVIQQTPNHTTATISETQYTLIDTPEMAKSPPAVPELVEMSTLSVQIDEQVDAEPPLFDDVPDIPPAMPINQAPEMRASVDLAEKSSDENVKVARGLFDLMPFMGKSARKAEKSIKPIVKEPVIKEPVMNNSFFTKKQEPAPDFKDPFENVDLPAFLRHR